MSVAFRRDGDEEHLEPRFELPIPPGPNLVTARGLRLTREKVGQLEAALAALDDEEAIKAARRELRYWRTRLASAQLVDAPDGSCVAFACAVTFRLNGKVRTIAVVGDDEAEPAADRLAFSAPLVRAMMEAEVGERVDFAGRSEAIEILAIAPLEP
ncbi:GreA/GreB family elongation factor [Novosphingobium sp. 1949]|uniref:GreA/GreB family elongation factor n=1 Tax=Novosphingobium organovorum TaxID=2930092 RepID=A0ABT0BD77_9SPHN|nr:GreA/GreB family elongation factor [Novosphingobium organovorum]MCJ2182759.1 GreA/GreB family elongation factor [Novosphingobium organovorum]